MFWVIIILCLIGLYKGWEATIACINSNSFTGAKNMILMTLIYLSLLIITIYVVRNYNIEKKFNLEPTAIVEYP